MTKKLTSINNKIKIVTKIPEMKTPKNNIYIRCEKFRAAQKTDKKKDSMIMMPHKLTYRQNRFAIVSSVILKVFNPCKYLTITIQPFVKQSMIQCLFCL